MNFLRKPHLFLGPCRYLDGRPNGRPLFHQNKQIIHRLENENGWNEDVQIIIQDIDYNLNKKK
jgi:hypothetical protein